MGIRHLHTFLRAHCPHVYTEVSLTQFAFKKIAIDLSIYLCRYKVLYKDKWRDAFLNLMTCLREHEIHFIFVFDSKSPPEKDDEKRHRMEQRDKLRRRVEDMERGVKMLLEKNEVAPSIERFVRQHQRYEDHVSIITKEIERLRSHLFDIRTDDFDSLRELFAILDVPFVQADAEAEHSCAAFCKRGAVHAVLTEDTDIMAHGAPMYISKIDIVSSTVTCIVLAEVLESLGLTYEQFRDFCIMCGTDFNQNIHGIGPERAFKLIREHKTLENISNVLDTRVLNYPRVRTLFTADTVVTVPPRCVCGIPDRNDLQRYCFTHNSLVDHNRVFHAFTHPFYTIQVKDESFPLPPLPSSTHN
jgi:5'-3' exonuclease